jgi:paraquat-inducible protein B
MAMEPEPSAPTETSGPLAAAPPPRAKVVAERRWSWAWLAPLVAITIVGYLAYQSWEPAGPRLTLHFEQGYGLKPGDVLRHRGVVIGEVRDVRIASELDGVDVAVDLKQEAAPIARQGSLFWIVRPRIDFTAIDGLDTLIGPHYLAVLPGEGPETLEFTGREEAPLNERVEPGGLEVVLQSVARGGLRPGAAVYYRQFRVGTVMSVGLAADGSAVEARAYIRPPYRKLLREGTQFWNVGGLQFDAGWFKGLSVEVATAEDLLRGGVAFATPDDAGAPVVDGHRFVVAPKADDDWHEWSPSLPMPSAELAESKMVPSPQRAVLTWKHNGTFRNPERRREGYVLGVPDGYLGLADLLLQPEDSFADSALVAIAGKAYAAQGNAMRMYGELALLPIKRPHDGKLTPWPADQVRTPSAPEDCLAFTSDAAEPRAIAAARCTDEQRAWAVHPAVGFNAAWHGAPVVAVQDGKLIGFLAWRDEAAEIIPLRNARTNVADADR